MAHRSAGEATLVAALLALLAAAIVYPLLQVLSVAFLDGGAPTLRPLGAFFARPLFREAFVNTLLAGVLAVVIGSVIAVPLALLTVRYRFPGRTLVTVLGVLPLVIPPFVGAVAFQQILGRSGAVNLLLRRTRASRSRCGGPSRVVLVQSLHYFPFILLNTAAALAGLDRSLEEGPEPGSSGTAPLPPGAAPAGPAGYAAGALLTFIRVIDDLGTPSC
jgi:iron(III) transport system permease protein